MACYHSSLWWATECQNRQWCIRLDYWMINQWVEWATCRTSNGICDSSLQCLPNRTSVELESVNSITCPAAGAEQRSGELRLFHFFHPQQTRSSFVRFTKTEGCSIWSTQINDVIALWGMTCQRCNTIPAMRYNMLTKQKNTSYAVWHADSVSGIWS